VSRAGTSSSGGSPSRGLVGSTEFIIPADWRARAGRISPHWVPRCSTARRLSASVNASTVTFTRIPVSEWEAAKRRHPAGRNLPRSSASGVETRSESAPVLWRVVEPEPVTAPIPIPAGSVAAPVGPYSASRTHRRYPPDSSRFTAYTAGIVLWCTANHYPAAARLVAFAFRAVRASATFAVTLWKLVFGIPSTGQHRDRTCSAAFHPAGYLASVIADAEREAVRPGLALFRATDPTGTATTVPIRRIGGNEYRETFVVGKEETG
jgi:hypothetical protein